jgi:site-specific recombinase XerD
MNLEQYLKENYSPTATGNYQYLINRFKSLTHSPERATYQDVMSYLAQLRETGKHPKTIRNHLFAIKIYYRYLVAEGVRNDHPCQFLFLADKINRAVDVQSLYSMPQMEKFLESYEPNPKNQPTKQREKVVISLLIYQALTVLEISQLNVQDLNLEKGTIRVKGNACLPARQVKNNGRTLDLKPSQIMLLHNYLNETREQLIKRNGTISEALLLGNTGKRILPHGISRTINLGRKPTEKMQPLKIRQSVIAHLLKSGNDLRIVQVFAGHKRAAATEEYKQTGLEELKAAIQKHHPLQ